MSTWHVITNETGTILGVYGEALLSDAQSLARRVERETGCATYRHTIENSRRPSVGESISMKGRIFCGPSEETAKLFAR